MEIIRVPRIVRETAYAHRIKGRSVGLVPTMGALHEGHLSLVRRAKQDNDVVVASIFVNPTQFGPNEDFSAYPRDQEGDLHKLESAGTDIVFLPDVQALYPKDFLTSVSVAGLSDKLCGAFRHGHFTGVATIVNKLFNIVRPIRSYFGQKDYQQTVIIRSMVRDLNVDVDVIVCPTVRETDGLAMSSRNAYMNPEQRRASVVLFRTLTAASSVIRNNGGTTAAVNEALHVQLNSEPLLSEVQYAGVYDPETLDALTELQKDNLLAIAVKIGTTRLIDNMLVQR
ncbi:MAG TPA: pantoate--beta-alanine ligase [Dissulfurispiraceae bacterium]|nr:pantoate--beta-alanine ligase [Dissulfurispiraceae bacterium]